jgi:hypothetical protein
VGGLILGFFVSDAVIGKRDGMLLAALKGGAVGGACGAVGFGVGKVAEWQLESLQRQRRREEEEDE